MPAPPTSNSPKFGANMNLFANKAVAGVIIGVVVAFFVTFGGATGLLWLLLFSAIGGVVGAQLDGRLDLARIVSPNSGRGRG